MKLAHGPDVDVVALALDGVHGDDVLAQALGALELRQLEHEVVHLLGSAHHLGRHLQGVRAHLLDIGEVDAVQDAFDAVDHDVEGVCQGGDVLALDRCDEGGDQRVVDLVDQLVCFLLDLVHLGDGLLDLGGIEVMHDGVELDGRLAGELGRRGEAIVVERVVFLSHDESFGCGDVCGWGFAWNRRIS